jgi:hypothetical protein
MTELPSFDELVKLHKSSPDELEALRLSLIEEVILSAPEEKQARLRGLQFQIDAQRSMAKNPIDATVRISRMLQDSFVKLRAALEVVQGKDANKQTIPQSNPERLQSNPERLQSNVVSFKKDT